MLRHRPRTEVAPLGFGDRFVINAGLTNAPSAPTAKIPTFVAVAVAGMVHLALPFAGQQRGFANRETVVAVGKYEWTAR
ncbi:hypothetical protein AWC15_09010 [Mycobacterium lacus]|nr:hypothetical protein AWC15_09010 [Mycobacterium lacus]